MYELNEIQQQVQQMFKEFSDKHIAPVASKIDTENKFPLELFRRIGDMGFFGMRYPEIVGGSGSDVISYSLAVTELARGSLSLAAVCTMQSLMGTHFLYRFGDKSIFENYFLPALKGELIGAICMTEPNSGSDLMSMTTTAKITENGFTLTGQKTWVTSAPVADFFTVFAKTDNSGQLSIFFCTSKY